MPGPRTTLLIEGSFKELVEELADYIDNLKKSQEAAESIRAEVDPLLEKYAEAENSEDEDALDQARDDVLKIIVPSSTILNSSADKDFIASYNLLIHLIRQSDNVNSFLQSICRSLSEDLPPSPAKVGLALTVLTTIFNTADQDDGVRYAIFSAILDVVAKTSNYDHLRSQLAHLDGWLAQWGTPPARQRTLYMKVAQIARDDGEAEEAYDYLIRALRTVPSSESSSEEARRMSLEALKMSLGSPTHFEFEDLTSLDSIQALRNSDPAFFELLDIFTSNGLEDYISFKSEHSGWIEQQSLDDAVLTRKIRLLTLASLASTGTTAQTRSLPYQAIADGLQVSPEEVEMWVIDVIRAGLVEGKLSQSTKTFLIHRSTYRVFGESQWREVAGRLDLWRNSLVGVLSVIRQEKESMIAQKEQELRALEMKVNGSGGGYRRAVQREPVDLGME